jgi:hypothetical protein
MNDNKIICYHNRVSFFGVSSLVGNYVCDDCGKEISVEDYNKRREREAQIAKDYLEFQKKGIQF